MKREFDKTNISQNDLIKEGYKDSALGEIPEDWEVGVINDFVETFKGGAALKPSDFVVQKGFPVIPKKAIGRGGKLEIDRLNPTFCSLTFAEANATNIIDESYIVTTLRDLVPSGPSIGYMVQFHSKERYVLAQGVYGFKVNESICRDFLVQYSNTLEFRKVMQQIKVGSTQVHIRNKDYFGVTIPLPPLPEQQKIAQILSTVDEKIDIINQQIAETTELKKGLMQRLLTKGIGHTKFKDSPLGEIPKSWEVVKLGDVLSFITYGFTNPMPTVKDGILMITATNVKNGIIDVDGCRRTSIEAYTNLLTEKSKPKENDILLTKDGSLGRVALVGKEKMCINQSIALLRCNEFVKHEFLTHLLQAPFYQAKMIGDAGGSTIKHIYITRVDKMKIVMPSISEQNHIASIFSTVDNKLEILKDKKSEHQELKKGLMQQLLTGKVRVKVEERVAQ